jgi:K319-like protein/putative extracellular protein
MSNHFVDRLLSSFTGKTSTAHRRAPRRPAARRHLSFESLESRQMMSATPNVDLAVSANTGEKPESKLWEYQGQWYSAMPNKTGTWVWRLDGSTWTPQLKISTNTASHADVKVDGDVAHILLFEGTNSELANVQFDTGLNNYKMWTLQPQTIHITLDSKVETATIDIDSTGRMWLASDAKSKSTMQVRYSDGNYTNWSAPITIAAGVAYDDISDIIAMPNHTIGVFWSDQHTRRFGFRTHVDGTDPNLWTANEVPAGQWAQNRVHGMADDHMHLAVASDGTLYAAAKTGYDTKGYPTIILLVRRPNGVWDAPYSVNTGGTRPVIIVNEAANRLIIAYSSKDGGGNILYRESPLGTISLSPEKVMIAGKINNVTTAKQESTDGIVFMAESGGMAKSVMYHFDNMPPVVSAGPSQTVHLPDAVVLSGTATDDGKPSPASLFIGWTLVSGPASVTFGNASALQTSAQFSIAGTYVLRLSVSDGQLTSFSDLTITVLPPLII